MLGLCVAALSRALIPAGYMPGNLLHGEWMTLCPVGSAAAFELVAPHHAHHHKADGVSVDDRCAIGLGLLADMLVPAPPAARITIRPPAIVGEATVSRDPTAFVAAVRNRGPPAPSV